MDAQLDETHRRAPIPELDTDALARHPYAAFLARMQKPGRYLGNEEQSIVKDDAGIACRFVLAFPDLYEIGMSHLGTRILYDLINKHDDLACERAFSPWMDMEAELRDRDLPLVSLETYRPLREFDVVGVSLQYELSYSNVLLNLELGGVAIRSVDRTQQDPIVFAGGPTTTHPEPLAPFIDVFLVGEAEEVLPGLLRTIGQMRAEGRDRLEILAVCAKTPGMYVPRFYDRAEEPRSGLMVVTGPTEQGRALGVPERVGRVFVRDLDEFPFPTRFPVPYAEAIFDRASVEITRGCTEGCRFCQAGMIYRPVRERKPEDIVDAVLEGAEAGGFDETSLTALSTADVSCIDPLIKTLVPKLAERKIKLGIASLRAYGLNEEMLDEIKKVGIDGLTFAPEAGTQRMRDVINKNVSDEDIEASARRIFERGYDRMKLYFIMGLPTETDEDVAGIVETGRRCRQIARDVARAQNRPDKMAQVTVSVSQHVPKPHTPFQWAAMDSMEDLKTKVTMLRELAKQAKVGLKTHTVHESWVECLFARGDIRMADVLEHAYQNGARFDGWREGFSMERWLDALEAHDIEPARYTQTLPVGVPLPWSHIDVGLEPGFLEGEYKKALKSRLSPPCGKPAGAQVHHTNVEAALAEKKRLVCYDCGVACDLTDMRDERIVALRALDQIREEEITAEAEAEAQPAATFVPLDRLRGRLSKSILGKDSAWAENAEAPYSKVRLFFAKTGTLAFLSHLDLVRILPRMIRRAGIEMGFSRGYNPQPRMSFGPALALGMQAFEDVADLDLLLPRSAEDMAEMLTDEERQEMADDVAQRLRAVAPPGLIVLGARIVVPGEKRLGELIAGADFRVTLTPEQAERARERLADLESRDTFHVARKVKQKKHKRRGPQQFKDVDVRESIGPIRVEDDALSFRLITDGEGASVRPRELAQYLAGEEVEDHRYVRERLLVRRDEGLAGLKDVGGLLRAAHRRHPVRDRVSSDNPDPAALT